MTKNERIKLAGKATRERHASLTCKVYELKFDKSHLSKKKQEYLNRLFLEAKWLYNCMLSTTDPVGFNTKVNEISIRGKDKKTESRSLEVISSQMKQGVREKLFHNICGLAAKKKKGERVGRLKFKSRSNSIYLKQFDNTYKLKGKYLKLQGFKKGFKLEGVKQIPIDAEITTANLIRKCDNYYLQVTCYLPKEEQVFEKEAIGIDFGIKTSLTFSNGEKYNFQFPIPKDLKRLQRQRKNKKEGSKNLKKLDAQMRKKYNKLSNQKKDAKNKIVSHITKKYKLVCVQDENIKGWHEKWFGKQVQHSILGGIMSDLKRKSHTLSLVDRYFPTTQLCPVCNERNKELTLKDRVFICNCGYHEDRDIHAARNVLIQGLKQTGMECISSMPVEGLASNLVATIEPCQVGFSEAGSHNLKLW